MSDIFSKDGKVFVEGEEYDAVLPISEDERDVFTEGEAADNVIESFVFDTGGIDGAFPEAVIEYDTQGVPVKITVGGYEYELIHI